MPWQCDDIELLESTLPAADGMPLQVSVDLIDEDPNQPRTEFEPARLEELKQSIAERGVLQPVSIRPHPERPQRWMLNFGARRLRASRAAGRSTIPAYIDRKPGDYDQVIENEQREGLEPLELALFLRGRLQAGDSRTEVARRLSKSQAFITLVLALVEPPDFLMRLYRERKCRGLLELYELRRLHERHPRGIERWAEAQTEISRSDVLALKATLTKGAPVSARTVLTSDLRSPGFAGFNALKSDPKVGRKDSDETAGAWRSATPVQAAAGSIGPDGGLLHANLPSSGTPAVSAGSESMRTARQSPKPGLDEMSLNELVAEAVANVARLEWLVSVIRTHGAVPSADATADLRIRLGALIETL